MTIENLSLKRKYKTTENRYLNYRQNQVWFQVKNFNRHFKRKSGTEMTIKNRSLKPKCKTIENRYLNYFH